MRHKDSLQQQGPLLFPEQPCPVLCIVFHLFGFGFVVFCGTRTAETLGTQVFSVFRFYY